MFFKSPAKLAHFVQMYTFSVAYVWYQLNHYKMSVVGAITSLAIQASLNVGVILKSGE